MTTRSCVLTVGLSALVAAGTFSAAVPASAAPGSAGCISAQNALSTELGLASVDITLANQLRSAMASLDSLRVQIEPLYAEAELALEDELAALDAALEVEAAAWERLQAADAALAAADPQNTAAFEAAEQEQRAAQAAYEAADAEVVRADAAYIAAADAAYSTPEILALEQQADAAIASFEDAFTRLGLTEGSDSRKLLALIDAAIAACSVPAVAQEPTVAAGAPRQRGLNIQTAANDAGAADPAGLALFAGLGALGAAGVVVVRRRSMPRA